MTWRSTAICLLVLSLTGCGFPKNDNHSVGAQSSSDNLTTEAESSDRRSSNSLKSDSLNPKPPKPATLYLFDGEQRLIDLGTTVMIPTSEKLEELIRGRPTWKYRQVPLDMFLSRDELPFCMHATGSFFDGGSPTVTVVQRDSTGEYETLVCDTKIETVDKLLELFESYFWQDGRWKSSVRWRTESTMPFTDIKAKGSDGFISPVIKSDLASEWPTGTQPTKELLLESIETLIGYTASGHFEAAEEFVYLSEFDQAHENPLEWKLKKFFQRLEIAEKKVSVLRNEGVFGLAEDALVFYVKGEARKFKLDLELCYGLQVPDNRMQGQIMAEWKMDHFKLVFIEFMGERW